MWQPFSKQGRAWEPIGLELRSLLRLGIRERVDPWQLAPKVGLRVVDGREAIATVCPEDQEHLLGPGCGSWSGGVYPVALPDGTYLCIVNPNHSHRRNKITLMEEIVHTHRRHRPSGLSFQDDGVTVRHYDPDQEREAYGVGAAAYCPGRHSSGE